MGAPFLGAAPTAKTTASQARLAPQARQKRQHRMRAHQPNVPWRSRWDGSALEGPPEELSTPECSLWKETGTGTEPQKQKL